MNCIKYTSICVLLCSAGLLFGQTEAPKTTNTKADKMYEHLGYKEAIDLYKQGKMDMAAIERTANGYRLNGDTWNAERWYSQIVANSDNPLNYLYYAQALHSNGKLGQAKEYYLRYDKMTGGGGDKRGERLAQAIDNQAVLRSEKEVAVLHEPALNTPKLDFSPAFYEDGVVFVSNRDDAGNSLPTNRSKDYWTGDDFTTLYFSKTNEQGKPGKPEIFETNLASRYHEGPLTFSRSGDQLFFTRNNPKVKAPGTGEVKLQIYAAEKAGSGWSAATLVDLGDKLANDAHPCLSPDGQKLYFASDRSGGHGGMDLYVATFVGGQWLAPVNLGPSVNTAGNELFPFVHDDGTLYFASDGWQSLGGLDIFYTQKKADEMYAEPQNLGEPFNSPKDDFGYIVDVLGTKGYLTSSRDGGFGKDDIYSFTLPNPQSNKKQQKALAELSICVYDMASTDRVPGAKVTVMEQVPAGGYEGVEDDFVVKLVPTGTSGEYTISLKQRDPFASLPQGNDTYTTDVNGEFLAKLDPAKNYLLLVKMAGYKEAQQVLTGEELKAALAMGSHCVPIGTDNCVSLEGLVINKRYKNTIAGATVTLINLCSGDLVTVQSDAEGRYEFPCLPCNCDFIVQGSKVNFKQDNNLASTVGMDCTAQNEPISKDLLLMPSMDAQGNPNVVSYHPDDNEKPINVNNGQGETTPADEYLDDPELLDKILEDGLTIELENIYYDFDKYFIRPDASVELDKVVALMQRHPDLLVELRSHTDARADKGYNINLSNNRAKAAVDYIVQSGIERSRITEQGYGESWLTNECGDGVPCSEPDHQMNRRTEIKIYKR